VSLVPDKLEKTVKIPVRIVDGQVRYFYGGELPKLREGAIGDLIVPAYAIQEADDLKRLQDEHIEEILPTGMIVLLGVRIKDLQEELRKYISYPEKLFPPVNCGFIEIRLVEPLCLRLRGSKRAVLQPCRCFIPALNKEAESLNHAYTLISEVFEPYRLSHSGNVFQRGYYLEGNRWRPLDDLRSHYEAQFERHLERESHV